MAFVLIRIDDRLIHGQVTVAWGSWLNPDRIVLVNDEVAACDWRCDLYSDSDAMGVDVVIQSVDDFLASLEKGEYRDGRDFLIVESPADLLRLLKGGLDAPLVNVGGMHHADGKRQLLDYLFVDDEDTAALLKIAELGTKLEARDVPQGEPYDVEELLDAA